ncbi:MAG: hypothetical protein ACRC7N_19770 [Clostridium sp.]
MPILKQCSYHGCTKILNNDVKYCEYHQGKYDKEQKERYKEYQRRRLKDKFQVKAQKFYKSPEWERIKEAIKASVYHIDIFEYYLTGKIVEGENVHHIIEIDEDWNSRLDINNLIYLTHKNHMRIHSKYNKSKKDREKVQKILQGLLLAFEKEFN